MAYDTSYDPRPIAVLLLNTNDATLSFINNGTGSMRVYTWYNIDWSLVFKHNGNPNTNTYKVTHSFRADTPIAMSLIQGYGAVTVRGRTDLSSINIGCSLADMGVSTNPTNMQRWINSAGVRDVFTLPQYIGSSYLNNNYVIGGFYDAAPRDFYARQPEKSTTVSIFYDMSSSVYTLDNSYDFLTTDPTLRLKWDGTHVFQFRLA